FRSAGSYENVRFVASDGLHQVSVFTTILIAKGHQAPTLVRPADLTVAEGMPVHIRLNASDPAGDPLHFSSHFLPGGATLNSDTGVFDWTPKFFQAGVYAVSFSVSDGVNAVTQTTTITVLNVNAPPEFLGL